MSLKDRLQNNNINSETQEEQTNLEELKDEYGALGELLSDKNVEKIFINKNTSYIEKRGKQYKLNITFENSSELENIIYNILNNSNHVIDKKEGLINVKLKDNSKLIAILPPYTKDFPVLLIRKVKDITGTLESLIGLDSISKEMALVLEAISNLNLNVLISGAENSGKTTLLGAISKKIPNNKRILTLETMPELKLNQDQVISLYADNHDSLDELLRKSLELNPDKIILSDCKKEARALIEASLDGKSFMVTINGDCSENALLNFEKIALMDFVGVNMENIKNRTAFKTIDVILQLKRLEGDAVKLVEFSEVEHGANGEKINKIFYWDYKNGIESGFYSTGIRPKFLEKTGFEICDLIFEKGYEHTNNLKDEAIENSENIDDQIQKLYSYSKTNIFKKFKK